MAGMAVTVDGTKLTLVADPALPGFARVDLSFAGHCTLQLSFDMKIEAKKGKKTVLFGHFLYKNDHFAKTGSGQT
jgi:hypothetical protein